MNEVRPGDLAYITVDGLGSRAMAYVDRRGHTQWQTSSPLQGGNSFALNEAQEVRFIPVVSGLTRRDIRRIIQLLQQINSATSMRLGDQLLIDTLVKKLNPFASPVMEEPMEVGARVMANRLQFTRFSESHDTPWISTSGQMYDWSELQDPQPVEQPVITGRCEECGRPFKDGHKLDCSRRLV